jgi:tetratricopeptide (TPR) repeat protein
LRTGQAATPRLRMPAAPAFVDFGGGDRGAFAAGAARQEPDVWRVADDPRPTDELLRLAEVLSGQRVEEGAVTPLDWNHLQAAWREQHARSPEQFRLSAEELLAWHRGEAEACEKAHDWWAAVVHLNRLIAAEPVEAELYLRRAGAYERLHADEVAVADYGEATALRPADAAAWKRRGLCQARLGRLDEAASDMAQALKITPRDGEARFERGEALARLKRWQEAADEYQAAGELDAKAWKPWQRRSLALDAVGNRKEAETDFRKALALKAPPEKACPAVWQQEIALGVLSDALAKYPDDFSRLRERAILHARLGRWERAVEDYDRILPQEFFGEGARADWQNWAAARARLHGQDLPPALFVRLSPPAEGAWGREKLTPHRQACLRLAAGDKEGFQKLCSPGAKVDDDWETDVWYGPGRSACLAADAVTDWGPLVDAARKHDGRDGPAEKAAGTLGALLYRAGRYDEAVKQLSEAARLQGEGGDGWSCLFLALAHHRLKHDDEARRWLARAGAEREFLDKARLLRADPDALRGFVGPTTANLNDVPMVNLVAWWEWAELELLWPETAEIPAEGK